MEKKIIFSDDENSARQKSFVPLAKEVQEGEDYDCNEIHKCIKKRKNAIVRKLRQDKDFEIINKFNNQLDIEMLKSRKQYSLSKDSPVELEEADISSELK